MTFQQYIDNPLGKKNAVFSQREMYKNVYTAKYGKVMLRENGKIVYNLYYDKKSDRYFCYLKIPSEVVENFYYDVVVEFYTKDGALKTSNKLDDYNVRFFSNDPSFVFTYLYVFLKNNMFIDELKDKASKLAMKQKPDEKNPYGIPGYVKSLYFAYLYMKAKGFLAKAPYNTYATAFNKKDLLDKITHADQKIADRQRLGAEVAKKHTTEQKQKSSTAEADRRELYKDHMVGKVGNVKSVGITPTIKKSSIIKPVSKITKTINSLKKN